MTARPDTLPRLRMMLFGWGGVGLVYFSSGAMTGPVTLLAESAIDRMLPYNPSAIWLYLSFFILIPYTYLCAPIERARWLARSMPLAALVSGIVFVAFPTTLQYPPARFDGAGGHLLALLLANDTPRNCLPSLHAALTLLCVWALIDTTRVLRSALAVLLGAGICLSVVQLRRHLSIDLAAGWLVGLGSGLACWYAAPLQRLQKEPAA